MEKGKEAGKEKGKGEKWIRPRHRIAQNLLRPAVSLASKALYGAEVEKFAGQGDRQYLILMNHVTFFDQFFVCHAFRGPVYFVTSEDLLSNGLSSALIKYFAGPIPIKKQMTDLGAVLQIGRVAREGGTIAMAPEGNRTYSGALCHINPAVAKLAKVLKLPVAVFRIEGGYGVHPRWSDKVRKGRMRAYVSEVIEPEEIKYLSAEDLYARITAAMAYDEGTGGVSFRSPAPAEHLERVFYWCPSCGLTSFVSKKDVLSCTRCGLQVRFTQDSYFEGIGSRFPYRSIHDWYGAQNDFVRSFDVLAHTKEPLFEERADFDRVILEKRKERIGKDVCVRLFGDRIETDLPGGTKTIPFDDIRVITVVGSHKLNLYVGDEVFQLKGNKHFNALKYMNLCFRYRGMKGQIEDGKFLGL